MAILVGKTSRGGLTAPKGTHTFLEYPSLDMRAGLGVPSQQGWTQNSASPQYIGVTDDTDGIYTVKAAYLRDVGNYILDYQRPIDVAGLQALYTYGGYYKTRTRLDTALGANGYFKGIMIEAADNPATATDQRFGLAVSKDAGSTQLVINTVAIPNTQFDEYHTIEVVIPPLFGAGVVYVDGVLTTATVPISNSTVASSQIWVTSGSSGGVDRYSFHQYDHFVVYGDDGTGSETIESGGGYITVKVPEGRRDYTLNISTT